MSGVEGYVESAASGLIAGLNAARLARGEALSPPPRTTAIGALAYYVSHANPAYYDPSNITFGIMPPLSDDQERPRRGKLARKLALTERALADLERWRKALESAGSDDVSDDSPGVLTAHGQGKRQGVAAVGVDPVEERGIEGGR
jgi:methylenetetrahydrofolate--tRNA-(uracil-5-)-methyltransferase